MKKWIVWTGTLVLVLSLAANVYLYQKRGLQSQQLLLNDGIALAVAELGDANSYFSGHNPNGYNEAEIINKIAKASGHFEAIGAYLKQMQVEHVAGIGDELYAVVMALSEPEKYTPSQVKQYKQFVHEVVAQLKQSEDKQGNIVKSKLQEHIDNVYQYMPTKDKQELYNL